MRKPLGTAGRTMRRVTTRSSAGFLALFADAPESWSVLGLGHPVPMASWTATITAYSGGAKASLTTIKVGSAVISKITGFWPVKAYHFYTAFFYCIGIAGVYLLVRRTFAGNFHSAGYIVPASRNSSEGFCSATSKNNSRNLCSRSRECVPM